MEKVSKNMEVIDYKKVYEEAIDMCYSMMNDFDTPYKDRLVYKKILDILEENIEMSTPEGIGIDRKDK